MLLKINRKFFNLSKNEKNFAITFFIFVFVGFVFTFYSPNYNGSSKPVKIDVQNGASLNSIVDSLYHKKIIPSKIKMKTAAYLFGLDRNIKAGRYEIPDAISYVSLLKLLVDGVPKSQKLVTIQEGIWQTDLAELLNNELGLNEEKLLRLSSDKDFISKMNLDVNSLEGYLLPESYYFFDGTKEEEILEKLNEEQNKIFASSEAIESMEKLKMNRHQILTMASIIDGESNQVQEFKRISGVYYNRLRKDWKLQADPTVQYVVRQQREKVNKIYFKDLEIDSKFNTYMYYGLPPSPINNPGKEAIIAALDPEEHDYFFFVADGKGGHAFSKSSIEHQRQVKRYRDWRETNK